MQTHPMIHARAQSGLFINNLFLEEQTETTRSSVKLTLSSLPSIKGKVRHLIERKMMFIQDLKVTLKIKTAENPKKKDSVFTVGGKSA
jgi:hypothetical protein